MTPSQARNAIKKSLKALIDPKPKKEAKDKVWTYFDSSCAYCGCPLSKKSRMGHIDHLYAEMDGGSNKLCNLVLSCSICNGDEKREQDWKQFIYDNTAGDNSSSQPKIAKISKWITINEGEPKLTEEELSILDVEFDKINEVLSSSVNKLRRKN